MQKEISRMSDAKDARLSADMMSALAADRPASDEDVSSGDMSCSDMLTDDEEMLDFSSNSGNSPIKGKFEKREQELSTVGLKEKIQIEEIHEIIEEIDDDEVEEVELEEKTNESVSSNVRPGEGATDLTGPAMQLPLIEQKECGDSGPTTSTNEPAQNSPSGNMLEEKESLFSPDSGSDENDSDKMDENFEGGDNDDDELEQIAAEESKTKKPEGTPIKKKSPLSEKDPARKVKKRKKSKAATGNSDHGDEDDTEIPKGKSKTKKKKKTESKNTKEDGEGAKGKKPKPKRKASKPIEDDGSDVASDQPAGDEEKKKKKTKPKKTRKRKKSTDSEAEHSDSESEEEDAEKPKKRKKKARKKPKSSDDDDDSDGDKTRKKNYERRNIRKIMDEVDIGEDARTAQQEEMERKKRLQEKMVSIKAEQEKMEALKNSQLKTLLEDLDKVEAEEEPKKKKVPTATLR